MPNLSGLVKNISSLGGGTPADDDYFIFGKTALKKISWESIKNLVTARENKAVSTTLGVNANFYKRAGVVYFRLGGNITKSLGTEYEVICTIPDGYRPIALSTVTFQQNITDEKLVYVQFETDGSLKMRGGTKFESNSAINVMFTYVT